MHQHFICVMCPIISEHKNYYLYSCLLIFSTLISYCIVSAVIHKHTIIVGLLLSILSHHTHHITSHQSRPMHLINMLNFWWNLHDVTIHTWLCAAHVCVGAACKVAWMQPCMWHPSCTMVTACKFHQKLSIFIRHMVWDWCEGRVGVNGLQQPIYSFW